MSNKSTSLDKLTEAYLVESNAKYTKTKSPYKNMDASRWEVVRNAYNRKVIRKQRRRAGKSNKLGCRKTPLGMVRRLNEMNSLARLFRNNREWLARNATDEDKAVKL